ncbi:hypothetical protein D9M68_860640 [compost metagenome]
MDETGLTNAGEADQSYDFARLKQLISQLIYGVSNWFSHSVTAIAKIQSELVVEQVLGPNALNRTTPRPIRMPTGMRATYLLLDPGNEARVTPYPSGQASAVVEVDVKLIGVGHTNQSQSHSRSPIVERDVRRGAM